MLATGRLTSAAARAFQGAVPLTIVSRSDITTFDCPLTSHSCPTYGRQQHRHLVHERTPDLRACERMALDALQSASSDGNRVEVLRVSSMPTADMLHLGHSNGRSL